jgi:hypothetical protein
MPPMHCSLVPQRLPHAPQLLESFCRFWQAPLHEVSPVEQAVTHWLLSQTWPAPHTRLQAPQFAGSVVSCTHLLLQVVLPAGHRHWLLTHWPPGPHELPHAPQLLGSAWVKVHEPLHNVWPPKHIV